MKGIPRPKVTWLESVFFVSLRCTAKANGFSMSQKELDNEKEPSAGSKHYLRLSGPSCGWVGCPFSLRCSGLEPRGNSRGRWGWAVAIQFYPFHPACFQPYF